MIDSIKRLYSEAEKTYQEIENLVLEHSESSYDLSKQYINNYSKDISDYIDSFFKNECEDLDNPILLQLYKIKESISSLKIDSSDDWESKLIFAATSLGHLNEKIVSVLCEHYVTSSDRNQASKINSLKEHLSKTIINDFHFINTYRNSILHANDFGYSLSTQNEIVKNKLLSETRTAIAKLEFINFELKNIKAS